MAEFRYGFVTMDIDNIRIAASVGADYHELSFKSIHDLTDEQIQEYINLSKEIGIKYETANGMIPNKMKVVGPDVDYEQLDKYLSVAFKKASALGVKTVVFGSGSSRHVSDGFDKKVAFEQLKVFLSEHVEPFCFRYGVTCVLENLSYDETNTLNTIDELYELIKAVESTKVRIIVDFFHFFHNKDSWDSLAKASKYIDHVHVSSILNNRQFPSPNDGDDYQKIVDFLRTSGYNNRENRITFEAKVPDGKDYRTCVAEALSVFNNL